MSDINFQERNILNAGFVITTGLFEDAVSSIIEFYTPLKLFLVLAIALIAIDSRFGIKRAKLLGQDVRTSRAIRKSVNKFVDYFCWTTLAGLLGITFGVPFNIEIIPALVLSFVCGIELNSIVNNYFEIKGLKFKFNWFKFLMRKTDTEDLIELTPIEHEIPKICKVCNRPITKCGCVVNTEPGSPCSSCDARHECLHRESKKNKRSSK